MGKRIKFFIGAILLCLFAGGMMNTKICRADSAEIEISSDHTNVIVGDHVIIYININSGTLFGDFEANLIYNEDILEYQDGPSTITGSNGYLKIFDMNGAQSDNNRKYALEFEAVKSGICDISLDENAMVYESESGNEMSLSSNVLSLNVEAKVEASNNTNLKSLKISPSKITPAFDPSIHEYSTTVKNDVKQLIVSAIPEDEKSTVSVSGQDDLVEGENKITIKVLAESGDNIEYTIKVFRDLALSPTPLPADDTVSEENDGSQKFEVVNEDGVLYAIYQGKYKLVEPSSGVAIPKGYQKTSIIISGVSVNTYTLNIDNDFLLLYAENQYGEQGFYKYDRKEKTIQRYVSDTISQNDTVTPPEKGDYFQTKEYESNLNKAAIVIALLSAFCILLIIVIIRLFMKLKGYKEDDLE